MSRYDEPAAAEEADTRIRRARPEKDRGGVSGNTDRLERNLAELDEAIGGLADALAPILGPEEPSGVAQEDAAEARSDLSARLDRLADTAERQRRYLLTLSRRVDL
jgi:hypothetical protein